MDGYPPVDLIILNWNSLSLLPDCLTAVAALDYPNFTVTIVDNQSTDGSADWVADFIANRTFDSFPPMKLVRSPRNLGYAGGNNLALRQLEAPFAVLLNPDAFVDPGWLTAIMQPLLVDPTVGIAGCKLFYPGRELLQHAGGFLRDTMAMPGHYGVGEPDTGQYEVVRDVDYVIGAAIILRRDMLREIGCFDEDFFLYFEEVDLCRRAQTAGYRVIYVPEATAVHVESAVTIKESPDYLRHFHSSRWRFLLKYTALSTLLAQTLPAEKTWVQALHPTAQQAIAPAYRHALRQWPELRHHTEDKKKLAMDEQQKLTEALEDLYITTMYPTADADEVEPTPPNWELQERPFTSETPVVGPLLVKLRQLWNSVATKWYVRPLIAQQSIINQQIQQALTAQAAESARLLAQQEMRLIAQDREQTRLIHDLAEATAQVKQLQRQVDELKMDN